MYVQIVQGIAGLFEYLVHEISNKNVVAFVLKIHILNWSDISINSLEMKAD